MALVQRKKGGDSSSTPNVVFGNFSPTKKSRKDISFKLILKIVVLILFIVVLGFHNVNSNDIKNRIKYARRFASNILSKIMNDQIGKNVNVLYESNKRSYTDNFFKVNLNFKNSSSKKMVGSIIKVKLKSIKDGSFLAS